MNFLTFNGHDTNSGPLKVLALEIENPSELAVPLVLVRSTAKYNEVVELSDSENCVLLPNSFFNTIESLIDFVEACPTHLQVVTIQPIFSDKSADLVAQTTTAVRVLTPTFGSEIVEEIQAQPIQGGANFSLSNFYLGGISELEITIQPKSKIRLSMHFGAYRTDRLVG